VLSAALAACFAAAGCDNDESDHSSSAGTAKANPHYGAPGAKVTFLSPRRGASLPGGSVWVRVRVSGFRLGGRDVGKAPKRGFGHLHFRMDGGKYDKPRYSGANAARAAALGVGGRYSIATSPEIAYKGLPAGRHTVVVTLANNDLAETGVRARRSFSVRTSGR